MCCWTIVVMRSDGELGIPLRHRQLQSLIITCHTYQSYLIALVSGRDRLNLVVT